MAAHACLKNELIEDEKYHNLMSWLKSQLSYVLPLFIHDLFRKVCFRVSNMYELEYSFGSKFKEFHKNGFYNEYKSFLGNVN